MTRPAHETGQSSPPSPLKTAFVPPFALQGQEFSCHLTWNPATPLRRLVLTLGPELELVHLYNVANGRQGTTVDGTIVDLEGVQVEGYCGFVLRSRVLLLPEARSGVRLKGEVDRSGARLPFNQSFEVALFRPDLNVRGGESTPRVLRFMAQEDSPSPVADVPITLENRGRGTCIVLVAVRQGDTQVRIGDYLQQGETKTRFRTALKEGLERVKKEYPKHSKLIDRIHEFTSKDILTEDEALAGINELSTSMSTVEKEDPEFAEDLGEVFGDATLSILSVDQRFTSWATALGSNIDHRLILLNPWFALEVGPEPISVSFSLRCFDLQWHEHKQLNVGPVTLFGDVKGMVPVCGMFQADSQSDHEPQSTEPGERRRHGHRKGR